jgi:hypothetical protein
LHTNLKMICSSGPAVIEKKQNATNKTLEHLNFCFIYHIFAENFENNIVDLFYHYITEQLLIWH